jgi:hypothetical protein
MSQSSAGLHRKTERELVLTEVGRAIRVTTIEPGQSDYCKWPFQPLSMEVVCTNNVLETIRVEAVDGFNRLSHGGLETGGILFGRQTERSVQILACQPLECEHKTGPSFVLSEKDELALQAALSGHQLDALQPVGLYMVHSRRGFSLAESDRRIMDRYFPEPWQMALLLMPAKLGPTRAGFFVRSPGDESGYVCTHSLSLTAPEREANAAELDRPNAVVDMPPADQKLPARFAAAAGMAGTALQVEVGKPEPELPPADPDEIQPSQFEAEAVAPPQNSAESIQLDPPAPDPLPAPPECHRMGRRWKWIAAVTLLGLCVAIGARLWTHKDVVPSPSVPLQISDLGRDVRIGWDPTREPVRSATRATLKIRDGNGLPVELSITRADLDNGGIVYTPRSEKIDVRLKLLTGDQPISESSLYFIVNPVRSAPPPPEAPAIAATPQAAAPPVIPEAVSEPQSAPAQTPSQIQEQAHPRMDQRSDRGRNVVRAFNPPVKRRLLGTADVGVQASLPDLPVIHAAQEFPPVPLPTAPTIGVRPLPAPVTPQTRAPAPQQPRSGRLIWTGDLRKNGLLALSPAGASIGSLNGRLPGFPVKISVHPAELVDGGIAIFSSDRTKAGTTESPNASNGWNVVVYKWDPRRTSEVSVIEPPGPSNDWRRLILSTTNHNVSVLVVDWQREGEPVGAAAP